MRSVTAGVLAGADGWRVWVTDDDLRRARSQWLRARETGAPEDRVQDLLEELDRMVRTAALQAAAESRPRVLAVVPTVARPSARAGALAAAG